MCSETSVQKRKDGMQMFREMRRFKQQLTEEECLRVLKEEWRGVLSLHGDDGYPYGVPMDFYYDEDENKLYFHCAKEGHKIDAARADDKVSFSVIDKGVHADGDWALTFNSVIVFGRIKLLPSDEKSMGKLRQLAAKCYPTMEEVEVEMAKDSDRVQVLEITVEHMTGKRVHEK